MKFGRKFMHDSLQLLHSSCKGPSQLLAIGAFETHLVAVVGRIERSSVDAAALA
jgi:hypothetical protein